MIPNNINVWNRKYRGTKMIPNNINTWNKLLAHSLLEGKKVIRRGSFKYRDENLLFVCVRMHTRDDFRLN